MTAEKEEIIQWLRSEFAMEQQAGFPKLKRVPDTRVIGFLDHFATLNSAQQSALTEILFNWSAFLFLGVQPPKPVWEGFMQATTFPECRGGLRYTGVNLLAALAKDTSHNGLSVFFEMQNIKGLALVPPQGLLNDAASVVPVGIPSLRKKVKAAFTQLFAARSTDLGSEIWRYEGILNDCQLRIDIRYSGKMGRPQLAYNAQIRGKGRQIASPNLCFESVFGVGSGNWDYLTVENVDRSLELLNELVSWLAQLPERLPQDSA